MEHQGTEFKEENDGYDIYIGVAPSDIDQNEGNNHSKCGWYFDMYYSALRSGPPHNYNRKVYGPRKKWNEQYVRKGGSVGVVMDTAKGELSFVLNRVNYDAAYKGIPLDKPLVPCVLLYYEGDSVELDTSEVNVRTGGAQKAMFLPFFLSALALLLCVFAYYVTHNNRLSSDIQ